MYICIALCYSLGGPTDAKITVIDTVTTVFIGYLIYIQLSRHPLFPYVCRIDFHCVAAFHIQAVLAEYGNIHG